MIKCTKQCNNCKDVKDVSEFYTHPTTKDKLTTYCKGCLYTHAKERSAITLLIEGLKCPEGSAVMYLAPTLEQARTIIFDLLLDLGRDVIKSSNINNLEITLINNRKILVRGADNPDSIRGVSLTCVVLGT